VANRPGEAEENAITDVFNHKFAHELCRQFAKKVNSKMHVLYGAVPPADKAGPRCSATDGLN
jgi:hypothetical protein